VKKYVPNAGDLVWLNFTPQSGHEQRGHRPALCVSPEAYNKKTGLALFCPVTSKIKGYPFEEEVDAGDISGVVLSDQVKSLDWRARGVGFAGIVPDSTLESVCDKIKVLLG